MSDAERVAAVATPLRSHALKVCAYVSPNAIPRNVVQTDAEGSAVSVCRVPLAANFKCARNALTCRAITGR